MPSLHGHCACMVNWNKGALRENCRLKCGKTFVSPCRVVLLCRNSLKRYWGVILWHLWISRARKPGPGLRNVAVEVFNVGGWLTCFLGFFSCWECWRRGCQHEECSCCPAFLLQLLSSSGSLIAAVPLGACFLQAVVGSSIWLGN